MNLPQDAELDAFYRTIASRYDDDYAELIGEKDVAFYRRMALETGGPVLEMGCGTGRVLLPVARAGVQAWGMDCSVAMLEQLSARLALEPPEVRGRVTLKQGDIRETRLGRRFRFIFAAGNVLHSFLERREQRAWLRNVRRHLAPGGVFCFDVFQFDYRRLSAPADWVNDVDRVDAATEHRMRRFCRIEQEPEFQRFRVEMRLLTEDREGRTVSDETSTIMQRWFTRGELENLLDLERFEITNYWGNFERDEFGRGSPGQIVRAVKALS